MTDFPWAYKNRNTYISPTNTINMCELYDGDVSTQRSPSVIMLTDEHHRNVAKSQCWCTSTITGSLAHQGHRSTLNCDWFRIKVQLCYQRCWRYPATCTPHHHGIGDGWPFHMCTPCWCGASVSTSNHSTGTMRKNMENYRIRGRFLKARVYEAGLQVASWSQLDILQKFNEPCEQ